MKALITGGAGFIGSHLVDSFLKAGHEVAVVDNMSSGTVSNLRENLDNPRLHIDRAEFSDHRVLRRVLPNTDAVVHLAALTSVPYSILHPQGVNRVNANETLALLEECVKHSVRRFIFASSAAVYGNHIPPVTEDMVPDPLSPYAASKAFAEDFVRSCHTSSGLKSVILRFMNVYGPRSLGSSEGVIPNFLRAIKRGRPLTIYGRGSQSRDFVHVSDVISSINLAVKTLACQGDVFNIGTGHPSTVNDLVRLFKELLPTKSLNVRHLPARKGEVKESFADISKAVRILGYAPRVQLRGGIADLLQKEQLH